MINVILNLFIIAVIVVFIVDISGAIDSLKSGIKWILTKGKMKDSNYVIKPIDCSLCMTWWCGLIYLLIIGQFTLKYIAIVCIISTFVEIIKSSILLIEDTITKIIQLIYKYVIDR